jgi:transcriptional regulator with XRE-family HTH domain
MITHPLNQLATMATAHRVELEVAVRSAGVARTTYQRWLRKETSPRHATTERIAKEIERLGKLQQRPKPAHLAQARRRA